MLIFPEWEFQIGQISNNRCQILMEVRIEDVSGTQYTVIIPPDSSLDALKTGMFEKYNLDTSKMEFIKNGFVLNSQSKITEQMAKDGIIAMLDLTLYPEKSFPSVDQPFDFAFIPFFNIIKDMSNKTPKKRQQPGFAPYRINQRRDSYDEINDIVARELYISEENDQDYDQQDEQYNQAIMESLQNQGPPATDQITQGIALSPEDDAAVNSLLDLGIPRSEVIQIYMINERNLDMTRATLMTMI